MSETAIHDAVDAAKVFFNNEAERRQYINREMAMMDYKANMEGAKEEGLENGYESMLKLVQALLKDGRAAEIDKLSGNKSLIHKLMNHYHIQ